MKPKKIGKTVFFQSHSGFISAPKTIYVVGCGGNGSHVAPHLARMTKDMQNVDLIFIDGDTVENKNIVRQHFTESDIGQHKAEVLATRYSALNPRTSHINTMFQTHMLEPSRHNVIVSCVDNFLTRAKIEAYFKTTTGMLWVDLGNEKTNGQVILSSSFNEGDMFNLPTIFELFPALRPPLTAVTQVTESCADVAVSAPQSGFVNLTCATVAVNYLWGILTGSRIYSHMTYISIDNVFESVRITPEKLKEWSNTIPRLAEIKYVGSGSLWR